jgi:hypothetical protein
MIQDTISHTPHPSSIHHPQDRPFLTPCRLLHAGTHISSSEWNAFPGWELTTMMTIFPLPDPA